MNFAHNSSFTLLLGMSFKNVSAYLFPDGSYQIFLETYSTSVVLFTFFPHCLSLYDLFYLYIFWQILKSLRGDSTFIINLLSYD